MNKFIEEFLRKKREKESEAENNRRQVIMDSFKDMPIQTLATAYLYAKNYYKYGEDVTKTWLTAIENASKLEKAYREGYYDALKRQEERETQQKTGHWEWVQYDYNPKIGNWQCSECMSIVIECADKKSKVDIPLYKYCPQCGCRIVESQESEVNNGNI